MVDYDADNVPAYAADPLDVPVVPMLFAPYLVPDLSLPLPERPIDLLFVGSMNPRRRAWIDRIEAQGLQVACSTRRCTGRSATTSSRRPRR